MIIDVNRKLFDAYKDKLVVLVNKFYKKSKEEQGDAERTLFLYSRFLDNEAMSKYFKLYFFFDDFKFVGYFSLQITSDIYGDKFLNIWQLCLESDKADEKYSDEFMKIIKRVALENFCKEINAITTRDKKAYTKWIGKYGFKEVNTIFSKKVF